ncbi:unnamed protein product [Lota lota]
MLWVLFVFLSYQDRNVVKGKLLNDAHGTENESKDAWFTVNRTICAKMSALAGGMDSLYQVSDGRREVRSVVNTRGDLVDCSVIVDRVQVKSFLHLCRLGLTQQDFHSEHLSANNRFVRMEEAMATCRQFTQRSERVERRAQTAHLKRSKRGFTYPGTLWCGAGNMADHDDHLGEFAETDSCCRTHDHCPHVIHAFSSNYGYTNFKWHSICHCDCDIAMKQCLAKVNDTVSRVVGQAFFNVIGAPCFEFVYKDHCVERHWYGLCKRYEKLPVAVPQPAIPYDFGGVDVIDVLTLAPPARTHAVEVGEQARPESATKSEPPVPPGESSLVTMVTAAEDFFKVLATVSTSQSSPADAAKGATPSAEEKKTKKKNRKNSGKRKKSQSHGKRKGKGRGRKPHKDTGVEDVLVASSGRAGVGNNFLTELKTGRSGHNNKNRFVEGGFDLAGPRGASNEVMKDEPATAGSSSPPAAVPKEWVTQPSDLAIVSTGLARLAVSTSPTAATPRKTKTLRSRKGERRKKIPQSESYSPPDSAVNMTLKENSPRSSTIRLVDTWAPSVVGVTPPAQPGLQRPEGRSESESFLTTARTHVIMSEEEMVGKKPKKRRKLATAVPIVSVDYKVPTEESVKKIGSICAPIASSKPPTKRPELNVSHRPEMYGAISTACVTPAPSRGIVKTKGQRLKVIGRQRRRGISVQSPFNGNPLLGKSLEHMVPTSMSVLFGLSTTTVVTRPCKQGQHYRRRGPQHVKTGISLPFSAGTQRQTGRKGDKTRKKTLLCVLGRDASHTPREATHEPGTLTRFHVSTVASKANKQEENVQIPENGFFATTTGAPVVSAMQLSIQRVKKQFDYKRRKELLLLQQQ